MHRYKIIIEYLGTGLCGWQRQENGLSVQEIIETAIYKFSGLEVNLFAAGRTDAGVHAKGQVAHFDLEKKYDNNTIIRAINHYVKPHRVVITSCDKVTGDFHARFSAIARHYEYRIINRKTRPVLDEDTVWHVVEELDHAKMQDGANYLLGTHDFTSFRAKHCQAKSPLKTLSKIEMIRTGDEIKIFVAAPSFLYHMVRNIVGTLKLVGNNKLTPLCVKNILEAKDRSKAGPTAPASGLCFMAADYPEINKA